MDDRKRKVVHGVLGECYMTTQSMLRDSTNPDPTTTFVELPSGEICEVDIADITREK